MPVVVTGAGGIAGRALLRRLAGPGGSGGEIRALVRSIAEAPAVREIIPKCAAPDLEDPEEISLMMHDVHTVVHLLPDPEVPDEALDRELRQTTEWVVEAAELAGARRFVLLSSAGADPDAENAYLRAAGGAEAAVRGADLPEAMILRASPVYGPGGLWLQAWRAMLRPPVALVPSPGTQTLAPVFVEDVAAALFAADDRRQAVTGTFGLDGPERLSADELIDRVAGRRRRKLHVSTRRLVGLLRLPGGGLSLAAADLLSRDRPAASASAAEELGIVPTPLDEGLRAG
jgi:NADH dehydrogenase